MLDKQCQQLLVECVTSSWKFGNGCVSGGLDRSCGGVRAFPSARKILINQLKIKFRTKSRSRSRPCDALECYKTENLLVKFTRFQD